MSLFTAQVHPGRALGFLVLGASLHDILTRLKAEPQRFPKLDLIYEHSSPVKDPVVVNLPVNGIRLRFDGPEQRLRLIEVLDFTKSKLTYNDREVHRPATAMPAGTAPAESLSGPTFRHIYNRLLGPTFPGEYIEPEADDETGFGLYVLSYPGVAFSFPINSSAWSPGKDVVSLLSSAGQPATSMAIFSGESWPDARDNLYTQTLQPLKTFTALPKGRESVPEEVGLVKIHGEGRLELTRPWASGPFWILLGETTPQELVAELGPPDAIYRKNDQRMSIHKARTASESRTRRPSDVRDDSTDTDQSSAHTATDDSEEESGDGEAAGNVSGECFFNYFYHGFDILISTPSPPSRAPPSKAALNHDSDKIILPTDTPSRVVASKLILHSNVPGSYPFNRHRRCRWEIQYLTSKGSVEVINSETPFTDTEARLHEEWKSIYKNAEEAKQRQRGMVLNRDWGDSPGSSCELLGGWEDSMGGKRARGSGVNNDDVKGLGNTTLFGFPGLVFEVLQNDTVSGLTVF
ncbi:hypothetical protein BP6252_03699 [Coleophoma cylindrospora]|uniref:Uncharacterized protein n=1 Tax=Coleophoma cylindrospora TaxID=1849047 RepID=A0A3D8S8C0_9HELO|nr:hypothetical protein BP6252_03699 [Coleophoma cylindrospora]